MHEMVKVLLDLSIPPEILIYTKGFLKFSGGIDNCKNTLTPSCIMLKNGQTNGQKIFSCEQCIFK